MSQKRFPGIKGYDPDRSGDENSDPMMECPVCHKMFDVRDPGQVLEHCHGNVPEINIVED